MAEDNLLRYSRFRLAGDFFLEPDSALAAINAAVNGLPADADAARIAKAIQAGNVWVNFYGGADKSLPFGGYKESGWGREGGTEGIEAFMEKKAVYIRL